MDEHTQNLVADFVATFVRGATKWWLEHERPYPPATMARKVRALIVGGISGLRKLEAMGPRETSS